MSIELQSSKLSLAILIAGVLNLLAAHGAGTPAATRDASSRYIGTVLALDPIDRGVFLALDDGEVCFARWSAAGDLAKDLSPGQSIRVTGTRAHGTGERTHRVDASAIELLGPGKLPSATPMRLEDLAPDSKGPGIDGFDGFKWVELELALLEVSCNPQSTYVYGQAGSNAVLCRFPYPNALGPTSLAPWILSRVAIVGVLSQRPDGVFELLGGAAPRITRASGASTQAWTRSFVGSSEVGQRGFFLIPSSRDVDTRYFQDKRSLAGIQPGATVQGITARGALGVGHAVRVVHSTGHLPTPLRIEGSFETPDAGAQSPWTYRHALGTIGVVPDAPGRRTLHCQAGTLPLLPSQGARLDELSAGDDVRMNGILIHGLDGVPSFLVTKIFPKEQPAPSSTRAWWIAGAGLLGTLLLVRSLRDRSMRGIRNSSARIAQMVQASASPLGVFTDESMLVTANSSLMSPIGLVSSDTLSLQELCDRYDQVLGDGAFSKAFEAARTDGVPHRLDGAPWGHADAGAQLDISRNADGILVLEVVQAPQTEESVQENAPSPTDAKRARSAIAQGIGRLMGLVHGTVDPTEHRNGSANSPSGSVAQQVDRVGELGARLLGHHRSERHATDLTALVQRVGVGANRFTPQHLAVVTRVPGKPLWCHIDPVAFESALLSLIKRAADGCSSGGHVTLALMDSDTTASLEIQCEGPSSAPRPGTGAALDETSLAWWMARRALVENGCQLAALDPNAMGPSVRIQVELRSRLTPSS